MIADAPLIETTTASLSRAVSQNEVLNLPLVNRDLYQLLSITGGVTSNDASNSLGGPEQTTTINGSQKAQIGTVNFQLDGGNNTAGLRGTGNPAPNPEAVQEFRVITSNFSAEYGRYPAGIVDVVTKSGTNQWRGAAFEFFRNEALNAKRWAPPGTTARRIRSIAISTAPPWRSDPAGQDVFLHQLFATPANGDVLPEYRRHAHCARAQRRLLAIGAAPE